MSEEKQAVQASEESLSDESLESVSGGRARTGINPVILPVMPTPTYPIDGPIVLEPVVIDSMNS